MNPYVKYLTAVAGISALTAAGAFLQLFPRAWGHQCFSILLATALFLMRPIEHLLNAVFPNTQMDVIFWDLIVICHFLVVAALPAPCCFSSGLGVGDSWSFN
jgi:hypothetical protein